ncbi:MAG: prepilin-type N-terminal cleavage/methylation domain-containing protein, partial [Planctomycetota bacterium]
MLARTGKPVPAAVGWVERSEPHQRRWRGQAGNANGIGACEHAPYRRGMTLIELLVVITIIVIVLGAALPALQPALEGRAVREAARSVSVYLGSARNRALETGRPCGVVLMRAIEEGGCDRLSQVEIPPPYAGDTMESTVRVQATGTVGQVNLTFWNTGTGAEEAISVWDDS